MLAVRVQTIERSGFIKVGVWVKPSQWSGLSKDSGPGSAKPMVGFSQVSGPEFSKVSSSGSVKSVVRIKLSQWLGFSQVCDPNSAKSVVAVQSPI